MPSLQQQWVEMDRHLRRCTDARHASRLLTVVDDMIAWSERTLPALELKTSAQKQTAIRFTTAGAGQIVWQVYAHT